MEQKQNTENNTQAQLAEVVIQKVFNRRGFVIGMIILAFVLLVVGQINIAEKRQALGIDSTFAGNIEGDLYTATITSIADQGSYEDNGQLFSFADLEVELTSSDRAGEKLTIRYEIAGEFTEDDAYSTGDNLTLNRTIDVDLEYFTIIPEGSNESRFVTARVITIVDEGVIDLGGVAYPYQQVEAELTSGSRAGETIEIRNEIQFGSEEAQRVFEGEDIVVTSTGDGDAEQFFVSDKYRFPSIVLLFVVFFGLTILFAGWKGITSIIGLGFTMYVLVSFVVPSIVIGEDPMIVSVLGSVIIGTITYFLAHGTGKRTVIALIGTLIAIAIAAFLSVIFVDIARLSGTGSEEAVLLSIGSQTDINLKGLLLGGIIFGALGVLDDVTTAQAAAVEELKRANSKMGLRKLYERGSSIGREHIVSLVNTLVLAYVGSSFPLLLLFTLNNGVPLWLTLNSEFVIEEVIRSLIGSSVLIFAVPITTILAAWVFTKTPPDPAGDHDHHHHH